MSTNPSIIANIHKYVENIWKYTGDILHFCGADGTACYNSTYGDPLKLYSITILRVIKGDTRCIKEAKLCKSEKLYQSKCDTMLHGFNGFVDFNNTDIFCRDFKNKVTQQMITNEVQQQLEKHQIERIRLFLQMQGQNIDNTDDEEKMDILDMNVQSSAIDHTIDNHSNSQLLYDNFIKRIAYINDSNVSTDLNQSISTTHSSDNDVIIDMVTNDGAIPYKLRISR